MVILKTTRVFAAANKNTQPATAQTLMSSTPKKRNRLGAIVRDGGNMIPKWVDIAAKEACLEYYERPSRKELTAMRELIWRCFRDNQDIEQDNPSPAPKNLVE